LTFSRLLGACQSLYEHKRRWQKIYKLLLCEGITTCFPLVLADSSRSYRGLIWVRGLSVKKHWPRPRKGWMHNYITQRVHAQFA